MIGAARKPGRVQTSGVSRTSVPVLAELTPSLHEQLPARRRRAAERNYARLISPRQWGLTPEEVRSTAQRAYTYVALAHVFVGNLCGVLGAVLIAGYVEDVSFLAHWPLLGLGIALSVCCLAEEIVGVRQAVRVGAYFRNRYGTSISLPPLDQSR
jgi:hypothetical protein